MTRSPCAYLLLQKIITDDRKWRQKLHIRRNIMTRTLFAEFLNHSSCRKSFLQVPKKSCILSLVFGVWRSSVARVVWDHEAGGSNPFTPIICKSRLKPTFQTALVFAHFALKRCDLTTYVPIHTWINGNLFSDPFDLLKKARSMKIRNGLFENMEMKGVEPLSKNTSGEVSTSVVYFHWFPKILQNKQKRICGSFIDLTGAQSLTQEVSRYCWDRSARYGSMQRAGYLRQRMLIDYYQQLYLIALIYVNSLTARFFSIRIPVETGASPQRIAIIP